MTPKAGARLAVLGGGEAQQPGAERTPVLLAPVTESAVRKRFAMGKHVRKLATTPRLRIRTPPSTPRRFGREAARPAVGRRCACARGPAAGRQDGRGFPPDADGAGRRPGGGGLTWDAQCHLKRCDIDRDGQPLRREINGRTAAIGDGVEPAVQPDSQEAGGAWLPWQRHRLRPSGQGWHSQGNSLRPSGTRADRRGGSLSTGVMPPQNSFCLRVRYDNPVCYK